MVKKEKSLGALKALMFFAVCALFLLILPISAQAAVHFEEETYTSGDKYYVDTVKGEYWVVDGNKWRQCEVFDSSEDLSAVTSKIRSAMINRDSGISFYLVSDSKSLASTDSVFDKVNESVYDPTDNSASGDYLKMMSRYYDNGSGKLSVSNDKGYVFFYITVSIDSDTTAYQEQQIRDFVDEWNNEYIDSNPVISSASKDEREYYTVKTIYNFITKNTIYFNDLYLDREHTKYPADGIEYKLAHTAFGALFANTEGAYNTDFDYQSSIDMSCSADAQGLYRINKMNQGRSVCDGYALLFSYMCRSNGIDCRVVTGDYDKILSGKDSDAHAWNMVYLKDCYDTDYEWYAVDATFGSQRSQKISDEFSVISYDFFLRGSSDEAFSYKTHQKPFEQYNSLIEKQSEENYRFNIKNIDADKLKIFVSRRRDEDASEKFVADGKYNLENYLIIDANDNSYKINEDGDGLVESGGFTYYGTGYWYCVELNDFAKGIEYNCDDRYLLDADTYDFDAVTINGKAFSVPVTILPLDMSDWSSYDMSMSKINDSSLDSASGNVEIAVQFVGSTIKLNTEIYDSTTKKLDENTDYSIISYLKSDSKKTPVSLKEPGEYVVCISYKKNYCGTAEIPFTIEKADLSAYDHKFEVKATYGVGVDRYLTKLTLGSNGDTTELVKDVDYKILSVDGAMNYLDKGTVTVAATDTSKYLKAGTKAVWDYTVAQQYDLTNIFNHYNISGSYPVKSGSAAEPKDFKLGYKSGGNTVYLELDKDYKITGYKNNTAPGTGTVYVEFIGNYKGSAEMYFTIVKDNTPVPKDFTVSRTAFTYNGKVQRPSVTVKDSNGRQMVYKTDFKVEYSNWNSCDAGKYQMIVKFLGDYSDTKDYVVDYVINPKTTLPTIKLNRNTFTVNGNVQRPSVTVYDGSKQLNYKKDFTVSYSNWNSKDVGAYTVTVNMIGNYKSSKSYTYYLNPKPTTLSGVTAKSKGFTVKWNKQASQITGYQIQYSTKSNFSNAATVYGGNSNATSKTITGRSGKTRYYVRIRTYKNIGGKYFYSTWSSAKSVVTLK